MEFLKGRTAKVSGIIFLSILALYFLFRNSVLHYAIEKVQTKLFERNGIIFRVQSSEFSGFSTVALHGMYVLPPKGDTLLTADTLTVRPSIWTLFTGTLRIKEIHGSGIHITVEYGEKLNNVRFPRPNHVKDTLKVSEKNYAGLLASTLDRSFNFAPQRSELRDLIFTYKNDTLERSVRLDNFHSDEGSMEGEGVDLERNQCWKCSGSFSQTKHHFDMYLYPVEKQAHAQFPLLSELSEAAVEFDSVHLVLDDYHYYRNELKANGLFSVTGLSLHHKKIAEDTVRIPKASITYSFTATQNALMLDSSSIATLDQITFNPYLRFENSDSKKFAINIRTTAIPGTAFLKSLPEGMFDEIRLHEADGTLQFKLTFALDAKMPDSVVFDCSMKKDHFHLRKFPPGGLLKLNSEFTQSVYEHDRYIRSFQVGPSNPDFTPLSDVSPYFLSSVLTSEDGSFLFHNGFNEDAFRKSIATNFKAGKFLRGGSTISMQLVKNVFLNRKKTIARKAEEALIVWLIESNRLSSKERMFEVYVNIIELGPNIYGIGEASRFYFNKKPAQLNLQESIFLASLLPHPKWFRFSFDGSGQLKPYLADYYRIMSNFMLKKNLITQEEHDRLLPKVDITGLAKEFIIVTDSVPGDGLEEEEVN